MVDDLEERLTRYRVDLDAAVTADLARRHLASRDADHDGRSHRHHGVARVEPLQHLVPTKENYVTVDSPTSESTDRGESTNRRRMGMAAAAVVVVIGVAGIALAINNTSEDDDEAPSPAVQPTVAPTTTVAPATTIAPTTGTYLDTNADLRVTYAVPAGWEEDGWLVIKRADSRIGVVFQDVVNIYDDTCPSVLVSPTVGPTVDDLASAWENLPSFNATAPIDITVDGFHGKQLEFTVPDYDEADCPYGSFKLLYAGAGGAWWAQGPNQHNQLWILDVNGTRLVIVAASFPDTSPQDLATLDEILASIQID